MTPWYELAVVLFGSAVLLGAAARWLSKAYREGDPGRLSDGWIRRQAADEDRR